MVVNEKSHPIDIIVKLAINGDIDPWKVDIVDLADKYLQEIKNLDIPDLRTASKILYGAVLLLKMKADAIELEKDKTNPRFNRKRLLGIKRYYTIDELANVLKRYISPEVKVKKERRTYKRKNSKVKRGKKEKPEIPLFHATLEEAIEFIKTELEKLDKKIKFDDINYPNKAQAFVSLLFLNYDKIINLRQEKHFGDIYIEKFVA